MDMAAGRSFCPFGISALAVVLVLADILLGNAAAFLAALMVADQFPFLRVGRGGGVVGYAAFCIAVLRVLMHTFRYPFKAFFCMLMVAGCPLRRGCIAAAFVVNVAAHRFHGLGLCGRCPVAVFGMLMLAGFALHGFHISAVLGMLRVVFANPTRVGRFSWHFFRCGNERHRRREDHTQAENHRQPPVCQFSSSMFHCFLLFFVVLRNFSNNQPPAPGFQTEAVLP